VYGIWGGLTEEERNQQTPGPEGGSGKRLVQVIRAAGESPPARTTATAGRMAEATGPPRVRSG